MHTESDQTEESRAKTKPNIVLIGLMGCGKTTIGELLARAVGFGFIDVDQWIEKVEQRSIEEIFAKDGEDYFRRIERATIENLARVRNHVISAGGGAVLDDENWETLNQLGTVVWIKTAPDEIARRIYMSPDELRKRPLIQDLVNIEEKHERQTRLAERIRTLEMQRQQRYDQASIVLEDAYSTPEISAQFLRTILQKHHIL